jgi:protein-L-isoaspartate(D-aspartate) O-methyltransferase
MGYENIVFKVGDGSCGWPQHGPFDKIIVTAGAPTVPETLCNQLAINGRMIIPAGDRTNQELLQYDRTESGLTCKVAANVVFVPLIGEHGWEGK